MTAIDFDKLIVQLLPNRLRKPKMIAFLTAIIAPLKARYNAFKLWEASSFYAIKYQTGQVAHLERVLNEVFDATSKRITIGAGIVPNRNYVYLRAESQPVYMNTVYLYNENDYLYGSINFSVNIPDVLIGTFDEVRLRALTDRYKRDSKNYYLNYFS